MYTILLMLFPLDWFGDMIYAAQVTISSIFAFGIELSMVALLFGILIGGILYFSTMNSHAGKTLLVNGIVWEIVLAVMYMALFPNSGFPDLSIFFRPA